MNGAAQPLDMPGHIGTLYSDAVSNLQAAKQQQWNVARYTVAAFGAIIAFRSFTDPVVTIDNAALLIIVIALMGSALICGLGGTIRKYRVRLGLIYDAYFSAVERDVFGLNRQGEKRWWHDWLIYSALAIVIWGGCALTMDAVGALDLF